MLRNTQLPLPEIAGAMGLADQIHLTGHFHHLAGVATRLIHWDAR
jgi:transcriptional regulator GlxA family with amidase domain